MHINDSKFDLGSKKDRHENLGLGFIGLEGFWNLLHWPGLEGGASEGREWEGWKGVIWVLETPSSENPTIWKREIELVRPTLSLSALPCDFPTNFALSFSCTNSKPFKIQVRSPPFSKPGSRSVSPSTQRLRRSQPRARRRPEGTTTQKLKKKTPSLSSPTLNEAEAKR